MSAFDEARLYVERQQQMKEVGDAAADAAAVACRWR